MPSSEPSWKLATTELTQKRLASLLAATVGVETPALVLDEAQLAFNLEAGAAIARLYGLRCRPHAKTHKSVEIARRQIALGAVGVCCQNVSEAEILAAGGIGDILVTNEVVAPSKIRRLAALAGRSHIGVCVDRADTLAELSRAARAQDASLDVYVELDIGQGRCGLSDPVGCAELAETVAAMPQLRFAGIQAFDGSAQHIADSAERVSNVAGAASKLRRMRQLLTEKGVSKFIITGGGTGTLHEEGKARELDEIQIGSYAFLDGQYALNRCAPDDSAFGHALFVVAQVISSRGNRIILDAGVKSLNFDGGATSIAGSNARIVSASDEHSVFEVPGNESVVPVGAKVLVIPSHCDPTVNLHRTFVVAGDGFCTEWPVDAQGAVQ